MLIQFKKKDAAFEAVTERLRELSLAFKTAEEQAADTIVLVDGDEKIVGQIAILQHLDILAGELNQWYYCNC